jgi:hypothetical protein
MTAQQPDDRTHQLPKARAVASYRTEEYETNPFDGNRLVLTTMTSVSCMKRWPSENEPANLGLTGGGKRHLTHWNIENSFTI